MVTQRLGRDLRTILQAVAIPVGIFAAVPAAAQMVDSAYADDIEACTAGNAGPENRAAACTVLIEEAVYTDLGDYAMAHAHRAAALHALGRDGAALEDADIALDYDPYLFDGYMVRGRILLRQGEAYRAIADFSVAAGLEPLDAAAYAQRGLALFAHKEFAAAAKDLKTALEREPDDPDARRTLAWIRAAAPDPILRDGAEALALIGAADAQESASDRLIRAAALAEAGQTAFAMNLYRNLVAESPVIADRIRDYLRASGYFMGDRQAGGHGLALKLETALRACLADGCRPGGPRAAR